jgi:valyl-tRNA synthetase
MELSVVDHWILSTFQHTAAAVNMAMETYRFDLAAKAIYEFVWDELCDWYLELSKPILLATDISEEARRGARHTLLTVLEQTLRLAHPFIPFMTEEIWQQVPTSIRGDGETIMLEAFPEADLSLINPEAEGDVRWIKAIVTGIRNIRGEMDISFAKPIPVLFSNGSDQDKARLDAYRPLLAFLIKPERLDWLEAGDEAPVSATQLVGEMQLLVPMSGLIDKDAEITRLDKEIDKKLIEISRAEAKINNPSFVERAPADVVQKEKDKVLDLGSAIQQLQEQKKRIVSL